MSTTTNVQNLIVNVFRPQYEYDTTSNFYRVRLDLSNVDSIYTNSVTTRDFAVGDTAGNVYVGSNAGNSYTDIRGCSNTTTLGQYAGNFISNVSNSVYLGYRAGLAAVGANAVIAIGANAVGGGSSNIYIGNSTGGTGSNNIFLGHNIAPGPGVSDRLYIGHDLSTVILAGDLSENWIGINTTQKYTPLNKLDVSGYTYILGGLGINASPLTNTLNVNGDMRVEDGYGFMTFDHNGSTSNTEVTIQSYTPGKTALFDVSGTVSATEGLYSLRGTATSVPSGGTQTIAPLRAGMVMIAVTDTPVTNTLYDTRLAFVLDTTTPIVQSLASNISGTLIQYTGSNIEVSNGGVGTASFAYSVTYFPMP